MRIDLVVVRHPEDGQRRIEMLVHGTNPTYAPEVRKLGPMIREHLDRSKDYLLDKANFIAALRAEASRLEGTGE